MFPNPLKKGGYVPQPPLKGGRHRRGDQLLSEKYWGINVPSAAFSSLRRTRSLTGTPHASTEGTSLRVRHFDGTQTDTAEWTHRNAVAWEPPHGSVLLSAPLRFIFLKFS
jgi:hypothetical protein